jgi:hypothetical protein
MGYRATDGANYIQAVWPGQNLEDLAIEGEPVKITDGLFSTIFNQDPFALQTTQPVAIGAGAGLITLSTNQINIAPDTNLTGNTISTQALFVSSINATSAQPAFTNNLTLSSMTLIPASTTLMYWDSASPSSNINTSGYDAVVGVDGTYKIGVSYQFISAGSSDEVEFFILKNNSVISQSGGIVEVQNNTEIVSYAEVLETLANGDIINAGCFTNGSGVFVSTINGNVIQSPACILTMYRVDTV